MPKKSKEQESLIKAIEAIKENKEAIKGIFEVLETMNPEKDPKIINLWNNFISKLYKK